MALISVKCFKLFFVVALLILVSRTECRRSSSGGSRTGSRHSGGSHHSTSGGFHSSSSGGYHSSSGGGSHQSTSGGFHPSSSGGYRSSSGSGGGTHHSTGSGTSHGTSIGFVPPPSTGSGYHPSTGGVSHHSTGSSFGGTSHGTSFGSGGTGGISSTHTVTGGIGFVPPPSTGSGYHPSAGGVSHHSTANGFAGTSHGTSLGSSGVSSTHTATGGIGFVPPHSTGSGHQGSDTFHKTNAHQVGSGLPPNPSAPLAPTNSRPGIGFENINRNQQPGSQNNRHDIGFENVHNRLPPQTSQPTQHATSNIHHPVGSGVQSNTGIYPQHPAQSGGAYNPYLANGMHSGTTGTYRPYQPHTVPLPGGGVQYHPPIQPQYIPPATSIHVPVYQPYPVYQQKSSGSSLLGYGGSFLGGYLIGRTSGGLGGHDHHHYHHYDNNYNSYNNRRDDYYETDGRQNNYYTVHHYHQNREEVPPKFSVPDDSTIDCPSDHQNLCTPNTDPICLRNGTIMCVTYMPYTVPCGTNMVCAYTQIECAGNPSCNTTANQTYVDFYLPCISNVTLINNRVLDSPSFKKYTSYELCVTAIANPKKLESPVGPLALLVSEVGRWHLQQLFELHNDSTYTTKQS